MSHNPKLNLPQAEVKTRINGGRKELWDNIRKKWLACTPEEWVRQNFIYFLITGLRVDPLHIKQEHQVSFNGTSLRADIVVYNRSATPVMIVECKAPEVNISRDTLEQVCRYNMMLKIPYFCVTNGVSHYCFAYDADNNSSRKMDSFPDLATPLI